MTRFTRPEVETILKEWKSREKPDMFPLFFQFEDELITEALDNIHDISVARLNRSFVDCNKSDIHPMDIAACIVPFKCDQLIEALTE